MKRRMTVWLALLFSITAWLAAGDHCVAQPTSPYELLRVMEVKGRQGVATETARCPKREG